MLKFQQNVTKIIDLVYLLIRITSIKGQLSGSSFMELGIFLGFCNVFFCIHRVIYLVDLSAGFITKKNPKIHKFFFLNKKILLSRNRLAGSVNLVKLAWKSRSQYLFEKNLLAFYIQPGQILVNRFFSNDFLTFFEWKYYAVSQNVIFMSFINLHFSNCKF